MKKICQNLKNNSKMNSSILDILFPTSQHFHFILYVSIWTVGILIGFLCLLIILLSKPKLIPLEFYILITISISLMVFKIIVDSQFILLLISEKYIEYCIFTILNLISLTLGFCILLTIFYYSLFQASNVSRSRLFVMVHELVHKKKTFIIYQFGIGFLSMFLFLLYFFLAYRDVNECPNIVFIMNKIIYNGSLITQLVFASFLPISVYISTAVYIFFSNRRYLSQDTISQARFRKNLIVLIKFLGLAIIFVLSICLLSIFYLLAFVAPNSIGIFITAYSSFVSFSLMHLFLILVHSITQMTLKMLFIRIFKSR